ncbi:chromate transporter [Marinilactibacillus psychrotolerans]|uniref:Chromate transporter n=2 Tax=Marinilactibacillus psychrotolerans TaxID=191770 RepID=A0A5R9BY53_9LACT|nr:chromate transporter [Marinilactibacillus psychrotolerans]TLQ05577.1 chromate transporter [Marinilactibacillus psychrotolerans]GEQ32822.1 chromate transporter [Marinilactibacillus psychrotolerans]SJN44531.1 Chromate transport protein [Marinilactibacillus psychrotolerans 42ea]
MKNNASLYKTLFKSTFFLSMFTFGGGYVIVPLMEKKFVNELKWITEDEMLDLIALGQSSPGPIAVNTSILVGYRMAGILGALVTVLGTIIPPLVIMSLLAYVYRAVSTNPIVNNMLLGMQAGVAAIIVNVVYNMASRIIKQKKIIPIIVMILALIAGIILQVNILWLLSISGIIGAMTTYITLKKTSTKEDEN